MWIRGSAVFLVELAMKLALAFGVASAVLGTNADFLTYSRNHGLIRGY
jgi:hypothetical protein